MPLLSALRVAGGWCFDAEHVPEASVDKLMSKLVVVRAWTARPFSPYSSSSVTLPFLGRSTGTTWELVDGVCAFAL